MLETTHPRQITVAEMSPHVHSFAPNENKVNKISSWLINWIKLSLKNKTIKAYDFLPNKGDLAFHIGVSKGTMQNVFRFVEDQGLIESKQKIGTYISKPNKNNLSTKLTSKRELAIEAIKKHILEYNYSAGDYLISTRKLSQLLGISNTTVRMGIINLVSQNILRKENNAFVIISTCFQPQNIKVETLVEKTAQIIKKYTQENFQIGDKLPANSEIANLLDISVKTVHDAIKLLSKEGFLYTRRGKYGTIVSDNKNSNTLYQYEHIEIKIRHEIATEHNIGDKLPSIVDLASKYNVSSKTVKKALDNLAEEGYITYTRGRYGGTFVTDIPQLANEAYKWLALSPEFVPSSEN